MEPYQILSLLGVPGLIGSVYVVINRKIKKNKADNDAVKKGVQALLRAQMIRDYNHYLDKGYAPLYAKENFENCWLQYHSLGENGVMDSIHEKFLELPTEIEK